jgi:hypothetical protein
VGTATSVAKNKIAQLVYEIEHSGSVQMATEVDILNFPDWPVEEDHSTIDAQILTTLRKEIDTFQKQKSEAASRLSELSTDDELAYHQTKHTIIRLEREILEFELSVLLSELKLFPGNRAEIEKKIKIVGKHLNLARRRRRTYDYILSVFENTQEGQEPSSFLGMISRKVNT